MLQTVSVGRKRLARFPIISLRRWNIDEQLGITIKRMERMNSGNRLRLAVRAQSDGATETERSAAGRVGRKLRG